MRDEVPLVGIESVLPVVHVLGEVDLFGGPEGGFGLFVHLPNFVELDGKEDEATGVGSEEGLFLFGELEVVELGGQAGFDLGVGGEGLGDLDRGGRVGGNGSGHLECVFVNGVGSGGLCGCVGVKERVWAKGC